MTRASAHNLIRRGKKPPSFLGLAAASTRASKMARASSKKAGTRCELILRRALRAMALRYSLKQEGLRGNPDLVFPEARIAVFCDGDFWHGRNLRSRLARLRKGHNAAYWTAKILGNVTRDRYATKELNKAGWTVLRFWESDIRKASNSIARTVASVREQRLSGVAAFKAVTGSSTKKIRNQGRVRPSDR